MRINLLISSSSRSRWKTFTLNSVFSNFSFHTSVKKGFENVMTSSVMDGFLHVPMKNEIVAHNNKLDTCIRKRFHAFILKIKVGIICGGVGFDDKII